MLQNIKLALLCTVSAITLTFGQVQTPASSPAAKVFQTVGLTDIEIQYSRPSTKGRTIFGKDGLLPLEKIWRTGANAASKITFSDEVTIAGKVLKEGSYAILTKPGVNSWNVYFYAYHSGNWNSYVKEKPTATVTINSTKTADMVETFTIGVDQISMNSAQLVFAWENTKVSIPLQVKVKERVMKNIQQALAGPTANDYFRAASYMHDAGEDLNQALIYIQKATNGDNPRFFQVRREALILADLGRKKEAINAAKKSLELSKKAGNEDFVRLNEKSIKEWSN